jgi:hypothetical protein
MAVRNRPTHGMAFSDVSLEKEANHMVRWLTACGTMVSLLPPCACRTASAKIRYGRLQDVAPYVTVLRAYRHIKLCFSNRSRTNEIASSIT